VNSNISPGLKDPALLTPPQPFGYKTAWFAIHSEEPQAVAAAVELRRPQTVNWEYGTWHAYQYDDYQMFVSPPVNGWVLVMGMPIVWEADSHAVERMVELSKQFEEVQLFASMRTSSSYMWARTSKGKLIRLFYEGDGERRVTGEETAEEKALGFKFFDSSSPESQKPGYWDRKDLTYLDEEHVLQVAARWSVDPSKLDQMGLKPVLGLLGDPSASYPPKPKPIRRRKPGFWEKLFR